MQTTPSRDRRGAAWSATKLAVRAYSRNPTDDNESLVRVACGQLRDAGRRDLRGGNGVADGHFSALAREPHSHK
jgi:hypothetical protein